MADLTNETLVAQDWVNLTSTLSLDDDKTYVIDVDARLGTQPVAYWAETDNATPPTVNGHNWWGLEYRGSAETRTYSTAAGVNLWMRIEGTSATVTVSEVH